MPLTGSRSWGSLWAGLMGQVVEAAGSLVTVVASDTAGLAVVASGRGSTGGSGSGLSGYRSSGYG